MSEGYIKLHRKLEDWQWYKHNPTKILFLHLLLNANFKDREYQGIKLGRGDVLTGRIKLAQETGLSEQQIRTALKNLKKTNEILIKSTKHYSIIKLLNYCSYQDCDFEINQQSTNNQPTTNQQLTTNKNVKNDKNIINININNNIDQEFDIFWDKFKSINTGKGSKAMAKKSFAKARKKASYDEILDGLDSYMTFCLMKRQYTKAVTTWLNQECWKDDYDILSLTPPKIPNKSIINNSRIAWAI